MSLSLKLFAPKYRYIEACIITYHLEITYLYIFRKMVIRRPGSILTLDVSRSHFLCDAIFEIFFKHFNQIKHLNIGE